MARVIGNALPEENNGEDEGIAERSQVSGTERAGEILERPGALMSQGQTSTGLPGQAMYFRVEKLARSLKYRNARKGYERNAQDVPGNPEETK